MPLLLLYQSISASYTCYGGAWDCSTFFSLPVKGVFGTALRFFLELLDDGVYGAVPSPISFCDFVHATNLLRGKEVWSCLALKNEVVIDRFFFRFKRFFFAFERKAYYLLIDIMF
jgi:hypothetical protein